MVPPTPGVQTFETEEQVAVALAIYIIHLSAKFIAANGSFSVVLSGGTLIDTLRKLVEPPYVRSIEWSKWSILFLDERVVPPDHPDSNYKLTHDGFLSKKSFGLLLISRASETSMPGSNPARCFESDLFQSSRFLLQQFVFKDDQWQILDAAHVSKSIRNSAFQSIMEGI